MSKGSFCHPCEGKKNCASKSRSPCDHHSQILGIVRVWLALRQILGPEAIHACMVYQEKTAKADVVAGREQEKRFAQTEVLHMGEPWARLLRLKRAKV